MTETKVPARIDRYGNRWQQNDLTTGTSTSLAFNTTTINNQITTAGYPYDAAGNLTSDGAYKYSYDAEGNIAAVTTMAGGSVATYVYNALNQRVRTVVTGGATTEFVFNASGQRASVWNGSTKTQIRGQYYWGGKPVAYYDTSAHFQHQDWLGTERLRTTYNGAVEATLTSLPFGDGQVAETGGDAYYFAALDYDSETQTDHAQFRQYSSTQGRWMSPDPYSGSYDLSTPQSFNRYAYTENNPLANVDSSGLVRVYSGEPIDVGGGCFLVSWTDDSPPSADDPEGAGYSIGQDPFCTMGNYLSYSPGPAPAWGPAAPGSGGGEAPNNGRQVNGGYPAPPGAKERQCAGIATANKMLGLTATGMATTAGGFGLAALVTAEAPPVSAGFALIGAVDGLSALVVGGAGQALDLYGNLVVGCN